MTNLRISSMRATPIIGAVALLFALSACKDLVVPDYNNTSIDDLTGSPTPTKIAQASQGLLVGTRVGIGEQNGYVSLLGILGRESYNFDPADPRFITEMLIGPLDGGSPAFGGNLFAAPYRNIRNANLLLGALDKVTGLSAAQKTAVEGFAKTIQALDYLNVINTRDDLGAPIDVDIGPTDAPAPIVAKDVVFTHIVSLLDDGFTALGAGGTAFPFSVSPGFSNFGTPSEFAKFNRALKARVEAYRGQYASVLTALNASFLNTGAPLSFGHFRRLSPSQRAGGKASGRQATAGRLAPHRPVPLPRMRFSIRQAGRYWRIRRSRPMRKQSLMEPSTREYSPRLRISPPSIRCRGSRPISYSRSIHRTPHRFRSSRMKS